MRKAQLAVETLLIYGLAILVVMLAIGALFATGFLNFDMFIQDTCNLQSNAMTCGEFVVRTDSSSASQVQLELENTYGSNIRINSIMLEGVEDSEGIFDRCGNETYDQVIASYETLTYSTGGCGDLTQFQGKKVRASVEINWQKVGSSINRTDYGTLRVTVS